MTTPTTPPAAVVRPGAPRRECPVCGLHFQLDKAGLLRRHHGMTRAGFSTGERCDGVGEAPAVRPGAA